METQAPPLISLRGLQKHFGQHHALAGIDKRATAEGRPYLLDVHTERSGLGAASTWHPSYSIAALRKRNV